MSRGGPRHSRRRALSSGRREHRRVVQPCQQNDRRQHGDQKARSPDVPIHCSLATGIDVGRRCRGYFTARRGRGTAKCRLTRCFTDASSLGSRRVNSLAESARRRIDPAPATTRRTGRRDPAVHAEVKARYGGPRIHAELAARGRDCCVNTVAKLMRDNGIAAKTARKFRQTTDSNHDLPVAENLLTGSSTRPPPTSRGRRTSRTSRPARAGYTWPPSRRVLPAGRRLVDGRPHAEPPRGRCAGAGGPAAPAG